MDFLKLQNEIEKIWDLKKKNESFDVKKALVLANEVIDLLDIGKICVVEKANSSNTNNSSNTSDSCSSNNSNNSGNSSDTSNSDDSGNGNTNCSNGSDFTKNWKVNQWVKKGILLYFLNNCKIQTNNINCYFDKCENKFENWSEQDFKKAKLRVVNGSYVRKGAYLDNNCIVMPSFINIGANIGSNTMIDSMVTIGSCAKIGAQCHISANVCIGGVLEPLQDNPVIIEDNCFIGSGSNIAEGIIIGEGSVIASGVTLSSGTKIINRSTGAITHGEVPPYSVVVAGSYQTRENISINCAVIVKTVTKQVRQKTSINDILR